MAGCGGAIAGWVGMLEGANEHGSQTPCGDSFGPISNAATELDISRLGNCGTLFRIPLEFPDLGWSNSKLAADLATCCMNAVKLLNMHRLKRCFFYPFQKLAEETVQVARSGTEVDGIQSSSVLTQGYCLPRLLISCSDSRTKTSRNYTDNDALLEVLAFGGLERFRAP